jgi:hypothetical protein
MGPMNPYRSLGNALGTRAALDLAERLSAWHDSMVMHQRRAGVSRGRACAADCPHVQAPQLWAEALDLYGPRAHGLGFLRTHATAGDPGRAHVRAAL